VWNKTGKSLRPDQPVVDAAYFASAILKAPHELWELQPQKVKNNILKALGLALLMRPHRSNWLLFQAVTETCRYVLTGIGDPMRIEYALSKFEEWYKGDGLYGDGEHLTCDYYNSYVIHPMLEETARFSAPMFDKDYRRLILTRLQRFAEVQERVIAPDGSYPLLGRSITYRMAAFQGLAHCAYIKRLPEKLYPGQARRALDKIIKKAFLAETLFDSGGFLTKGLYGRQENLANSYTNTGSLYICLTVFLPLGLPASDAFWTDADIPTTWERAWSGENLPRDISLERKL
jgi:hypothetical protein